MRTRTDKLLPILTALFVGGLAVVAGAISYAHMQNLALHHDQLGWKANAFPISVDGIEVVASLHILAQRRAGRPAGWLPWLALLVGTIASLAANVAVGGHDPVGRVLAGWPAVSLLVSIKLLSSMFDHTDSSGTVRDDHQTIPAEAEPSPPPAASGTRTVESTPATSASGGTAHPPDEAEPWRTPTTSRTSFPPRGQPETPSPRVGAPCRGTGWPTGCGRTGTAYPTREPAYSRRSSRLKRA
ncbi:MAG TPA: DUF2637 domain-containing protein [Rugosimonospora sp.]|nr:DUF2637 domain-containing protein [Rugosimonospora sp.]